MDSTELRVPGHSPSQAEPDGNTAQQIFEREHLIWAQFAAADHVDGFCRSWLAIQCRMISGVTGGLVLLGPPDAGPFTPVAVWPDVRRSMEHLTTAAERALRERRGLLLKNKAGSNKQEGDGERYHVAYPLEVDHKIHGVVVLDVASRPESQLQALLRQLHWGSAWIETLVRRQESGTSTQTQKRLITVLDLIAAALEQERFYAAALALVTELATVLSCNRVSVGLVRKNHIVVEAVSHSAQFEKKTNLITTIGRAMDEAYDQQAVILYPAPESSPVPLVTRAHEELATAGDSGTLCTIPLYHCGRIVGALTLEKGGVDSFDPKTVDLCEAIAAMAGPVLEDKRKNDRLLIYKFAESSRRQLEKLIGTGHVAFKLISAFSVILVLFLLFVNGDYRVAAKTAVEGEIQRVITSPFQGYVAQADARAGDIVKQDQVLAVLEDKDLKLEQLKGLSQREQLLSQYREAMAKHERAKIRITMAQLNQVNAQLELQNYQLARTKVVAPFDGVIVNGDLSQSLGAPLEKGQVLFEIAPLDAYRVILQVDERDIADVTVGQSGQLVLSSLPGEKFEFTVQKITPVSTAEEGRNYFRVEARLDDDSERLRPGMEGVGKIMIERKRLVWIWTHSLIDWLRLWLWSWLP